MAHTVAHSEGSVFDVIDRIEALQYDTVRMREIFDMTLLLQRYLFQAMRLMFPFAKSLRCMHKLITHDDQNTL